MTSWRQALRRAVVSGSAASAASTAALAVCGRYEIGSAAAPTNAISHWFWGERAMRRDRASLRHTLLGYGIHHLASIFWATLYEKYAAPAARSTPEVLAAAAAVSAIACFVDYRMTPQRLRPGFERRLSREALLMVYAAVGAGLAVATLAERRR